MCGRLRHPHIPHFSRFVEKIQKEKEKEAAMRRGYGYWHHGMGWRHRGFWAPWRFGRGWWRRSCCLFFALPIMLVPFLAVLVLLFRAWHML